MRPHLILGLCGLLSILPLLAACGDDDPTGPAGGGDGGGPEFEVSIATTILDVTQDCDAMTGDFSTEAGDFFIAVELRRVEGGTSTVIATTDDTLHQISGSGTEVVSLSASGTFAVGDGVTVEADVSIYERDGGGVRQVDVTDTMTFAYDASTECWTYAGDDVCLRSTGRITTGVTRVRGTTGDPCSADLGWRFDASPVE